MFEVIQLLAIIIMILACIAPVLGMLTAFLPRTQFTWIDKHGNETTGPMLPGLIEATKVQDSLHERVK